MQLVIAGSSEDGFIMSVSKLSEGKSGFKEQISQSCSAGRSVLWNITCRDLLKETHKQRKNQLIGSTDD